MKLVNGTPFAALVFGDPTPGRTGHVLVLRASYDLRPDGSLVPCPEQALVLQDTYAGDPARSSPTAESDLAPHKPRCDVIVTGSAHAPGGLPRKVFPVRILVRSASGGVLGSVRLSIWGPGEFRKRAFPVRFLQGALRLATLGLLRFNPWKLKRTDAVLALPLVYENAYGGAVDVMAFEPGADRLPGAARLKGPQRRALQASQPDREPPMCQQAWGANPAGVGFAPEWWIRFRKLTRVAAPRIEAEGAPLSAPLFWKASRGRLKANHPALVPQGCAWLAKAWRDRLDHLSSSSAKAPSAHGQDPSQAFWNAAPPALQIPHPGGDLWLEVHNLLPEGSPWNRRDPQGQNQLRCRVPQLGLRAFAGGEGPAQPLSLRLDTVHLELTEPDRPRLHLVHRAAFDREPGRVRCEIQLGRD